MIREQIASRIYQVFWDELMISKKMPMDKFFKTFHGYDEDDCFSIMISASKCLSYGLDGLSNKAQHKILYYKKFFI